MLYSCTVPSDQDQGCNTEVESGRTKRPRLPGPVSCRCWCWCVGGGSSTAQWAAAECRCISDISSAPLCHSFSPSCHTTQCVGKLLVTRPPSPTLPCPPPPTPLSRGWQEAGSRHAACDQSHDSRGQNMVATHCCSTQNSHSLALT